MCVCVVPLFSLPLLKEFMPSNFSVQKILQKHLLSD